MTANTWMWMGICMATLILQFIFIHIVLRQSYRFKHTIDTIDPIDDHIIEMNKEMNREINRERTDSEQ